jgi:hypothetical protein
MITVGTALIIEQILVPPRHAVADRSTNREEGPMKDRQHLSPASPKVQDRIRVSFARKV